MKRRISGIYILAAMILSACAQSDSSEEQVSSYIDKTTLPVTEAGIKIETISETTIEGAAAIKSSEAETEEESSFPVIIPTETEELPIVQTEEEPEDPASEDVYGLRAMKYLKTIVNQFPQRVFADGGSVTCGNWLVSSLGSFGYEVNIHDFYRGDVHGRNIIAEKKGASEKVIVLCAHYDSVDTEGCDDNGSGVAAVLEVAGRMAEEETPYTLRFIFFDDEEEGYIGSREYVNDNRAEVTQNVIAVINVDCIAGGDIRYIHGGTEDGKQTELRDLALSKAEELGLGMTTHPEVKNIPAGTRYWGSDQHYFAEAGIPYIYLEANIYSDEAADGNPVHYQTADPNVKNGQIMHSAYDEFYTLAGIFPGRMEEHFRCYVTLMMEICKMTDL
ncbi:MAG: M28 family peptidase [Lachnospiraceae bacterium]|nr:M28 family peptidase [Lachnospiraceae bacterium]